LIFRSAHALHNAAEVILEGVGVLGFNLFPFNALKLLDLILTLGLPAPQSGFRDIELFRDCTESQAASAEGDELMLGVSGVHVLSAALRV